jgi:hypothetical protein
LFHTAIVEGAAADQDRTDMLLQKSCEGQFEIAGRRTNPIDCRRLQPISSAAA